MLLNINSLAARTRRLGDNIYPFFPLIMRVFHVVNILFNLGLSALFQCEANTSSFTVGHGTIKDLSLIHGVIHA